MLSHSAWTLGNISLKPTSQQQLQHLAWTKHFVSVLLQGLQAWGASLCSLLVLWPAAADLYPCPELRLVASVGPALFRTQSIQLPPLTDAFLCALAEFGAQPSAPVRQILELRVFRPGIGRDITPCLPGCAAGLCLRNPARSPIPMPGPRTQVTCQNPSHFV